MTLLTNSGTPLTLLYRVGIALLPAVQWLFGRRSEAIHSDSDSDADYTYI